jgi:transcription elongation factor
MSIAKSLPPSHALAVKEYLRISEEEQEAVMSSRSTFCNPMWVRIKRGRYKGDIGYVFDPDQLNGLIAVLIPLRDFPYSMSQGSVALLDRSRLPNDKPISDIFLGEQVVGCSYKGEKYYKGLLLKHFDRDCLELVTCPHVDDIRLHLQSGWDSPFLGKTKVAFSMQFLRTGDAVRVIVGELRSWVATVTSVDHSYGSASLELILDGRTRQAQMRLEDIEKVFRVGDMVRVVAGSHLGLEGYIIQMSEEIFHVCQDISGEQASWRRGT